MTAQGYISKRPLIAQIFCLAMTVVTILFAQAATGQSRAQADDAPTVLITGSSRGIGLEFARQYAGKGWRVIATCRTPEKASALAALAAQYDNIQIEQLDVTDHERIEELAEQFRDVPIDLLINNAGINPDPEHQRFGSIDYELYDEILKVNAIAPLKISEAFADSVAISEHKKIIAITSGMGSFETSKRLPGFLLLYRASKAALNMTMMNVAKATGGRGIVVGILHPGIVDTDQARNVKAPKLSAEESVGGMIAVIDNLTPEQSGAFFAWDGSKTDW